MLYATTIVKRPLCRMCLKIICINGSGFRLEHTEQKSNCLMAGTMRSVYFKWFCIGITGITAVFLSFPLSLRGKILANRLCVLCTDEREMPVDTDN